MAMNVEAQTIAVPTGLQDYRPALYGGMAALELECRRRAPRPARGRFPRAREPDRPLLHGRTAELGHQQLGNHEEAHRRRPARLRLLRAHPRHRGNDARVRSRRGDWDGVGVAIAEEWENRKRLAPGVTTPAIDGLIARAMAAGATAAKVCGAGGGGCLFCYGPPDARAAIATALAAGGARLLDLHDRARRPHAWITVQSRRFLAEIADLLEIKGENAVQDPRVSLGRRYHRRMGRPCRPHGREAAARVAGHRQGSRQEDPRARRYRHVPLPSGAAPRVPADHSRPAAPPRRRSEDGRAALLLAQHPQRR